LYLTSWEEGAKGPEGKSSWQELKSNFETFEMLHPGIPEKAVKMLLSKKRGPTKINKILKVLVGG
jgi:hypothetical protein